MGSWKIGLVWLYPPGAEQKEMKKKRNNLGKLSLETRFGSPPDFLT
jgi:hypothetical protein